MGPARVRPLERPHTAVGLAWYAFRSADPQLGATSMGHFDPTQESQAASEEKLKAYACELEQKLEARTRELSEALEQQTATSEVLRVISSSSPGELEPVFSAMLENALRICEAKFGMLHRYSHGAFVAEAMVGVPPALVDALLRKTFTPPPGVPLDRMLRTKKVVHTSTRLRKRTSLFRPGWRARVHTSL